MFIFNWFSFLRLVLVDKKHFLIEITFCFIILFLLEYTKRATWLLNFEN